MYDKQYNAMITSLSAGVKDKKDIVKVKVEVMMEYPDILEWNDKVYALLTQFPTPPFKEMKFGYQSGFGITCHYELKNPEGDMFDQDKDVTFSFRKFNFTDVSVVIRDTSIPVFMFSFEIPSEWSDIKSLASHFKSDILFKFEKESLEDSGLGSIEHEGVYEELPLDDK